MVGEVWVVYNDLLCVYVIIMCVYRECVDGLEGLRLPENGMTMLHHLAMNVRSLCADTLFQCAAKGMQPQPWSMSSPFSCHPHILSLLTLR